MTSEEFSVGGAVLLSQCTSMLEYALLSVLCMLF